MTENEPSPTKHTSSYDNFVIEKIIKLDKKHSSFSVFDSDGSQRLVVKNNSQNAITPWSSNQNEQNLRNFWWHINQYYFKKIEANDFERIEYLLSLSSIPLKESETRYSNPTAYETFKSMVTSEYKKQHQDIQYNKENFRNLQKQYYLSTLLSPLVDKTLNQKAISQNIKTLSSKFEFFAAKSKSLSSIFDAESKKLDSLIESVQNQNKTSKKSKNYYDQDEISHELQQLQEEYEALNAGNIHRLQDLKKRVSSDNWSYPISCDELSSNIIESVCTLPEGTYFSKEELTQTIDSIDMQLKYLKLLLVQLEDWQAAESIKSVIDYGRDPSDGVFKFMVQFDEAIYQREIWIDENTLDKLDQLREESLFKISKISQKTTRSLSSGNIIGFQSINEKLVKKNASLKEKPWKELMKKKINCSNVGSSNNKNNSHLKLKEFSLCHHCKNIFPNEKMINCKYRSSSMGLPSLNPAFLEPFSHNRFNTQAPKRTIYGSIRNAFSFYTRRNGELCCLRKFCRMCLKKYYEQVIPVVESQSNWKCPFCQCSCYCSRCMRNDRINRIASFYELLGGNLDEIKEGSLFEKLIYSNSLNFNEQSPSKSIVNPKQYPRYTSRRHDDPTFQSTEIASMESMQKITSIDTKNYRNLKKMEEENIDLRKRKSNCQRQNTDQKCAILKQQIDIKAQLDLNLEHQEYQNKKKVTKLQKIKDKLKGRKYKMLKPQTKGFIQSKQEKSNEFKAKKATQRKYNLKNIQASTSLISEVLLNESAIQESKNRGNSPTIIKKIKKQFSSTSSSPNRSYIGQIAVSKTRIDKDSTKLIENSRSPKISRLKKELQRLVQNSNLSCSPIENLFCKEGRVTRSSLYKTKSMSLRIRNQMNHKH